MNAKDTFNKRTAAKRQLSIAIQGVEDIIDSEGPVTTLCKWMKDARLKWEVVQERNEEYLMLKEEEEEMKVIMTWLEKEAKRV